MSVRTLPDRCYVERYPDGQAVDESYGAPVAHYRDPLPDIGSHDEEAGVSALVPVDEPCQTHHCDACGKPLPNGEGEGECHLPSNAQPAEVSRVVLGAGWCHRGARLLCPDCIDEALP